MKQSVHLEEIPYSPDSCALFECLRDLPHAILLDSSYPHSFAGRYDIMAAQPSEVALPSLAERPDEAQTRSFFDQLAHFHREHYGGVQPAAQDIPFCGGILGYLSYGCGEGLEGIPPVEDADIPLVHLQPYDWCVLQDHLLRKAVLVCLPSLSTSLKRDIQRRLLQHAPSPPGDFSLKSKFEPAIDEVAYREAFEAIQGYIHAGDCYQVNLTQRFTGQYAGDLWCAYRALRRTAAAPFSAFMGLDDNGAILSFSPERFLSLHGHRVETSPIKGTRPRYDDWRADKMAANELRESQKDRAENLMIVDLLRNDLGRSCVPGSIHVDRLFELQSFPTVHHLVSTISGELAPDRNAWDLLRDSFPGGSITGAPKRRSMQIINELEQHQRNIYCGSILYVSADGRMDSNIAIRTFLARNGSMDCWGGGGIVADSQWQQEYQETYDKVGKLFTALENL